MASSPSPPPFVPTLTQVVRLPERAQVDSVNPEWLVEQVLQRLTPQLELMVRQIVTDVLSVRDNAQGSNSL